MDLTWCRPLGTRAKVENEGRREEGEEKEDLYLHSPHSLVNHCYSNDWINQFLQSLFFARVIVKCCARRIVVAKEYLTILS